MAISLLGVDVTIHLTTVLIVAGVALLAFLFARRFVARVIANSILGVIALFLLNLAGFKIGLNLLNLGLVAAFGLPGFVLVLVLKALGWTV